MTSLSTGLIRYHARVSNWRERRGLPLLHQGGYFQIHISPPARELKSYVRLEKRSSASRRCDVPLMLCINFCFHTRVLKGRMPFQYVDTWCYLERACVISLPICRCVSINCLKCWMFRRSVCLKTLCVLLQATHLCVLPSGDAHAVHKLATNQTKSRRIS